MRQIEVKFRGSDDGGKTVKEMTSLGLFHQWTTVYDHPGQSDVAAIVEHDDGSIGLYHWSNVKFIKEPIS